MFLTNYTFAKKTIMGKKLKEFGIDILSKSSSTTLFVKLTCIEHRAVEWTRYDFDETLYYNY